MITKDQIVKIIQESVNAPSGDNSQPWRFRIHDNAVDILSIDRDKTIFNFKSRGDYIAHGAIMENIGIVASKYGFRVVTTLFPEGDGKEVTTTIAFSEDDKGEDLLCGAIVKRATNRKPYEKSALTNDQKEMITSFNTTYGTAKALMVADREGVERIGDAVSLNERLILESDVIRKFLFSIIRWTKKEEQANPGMNVLTLELAPPQRMAFRLFKNDTIAAIAKTIGFPKIMQKEGAALYAASGAMIAIVIEGVKAEEFVNAGRLLERIWLSATDKGLSIQPVAAVPYLAQRIKEGDDGGLSQEQINDVLAAERTIRTVFKMNDQNVIAMLFRIGKGGVPSAYSLKLSPEIE